jgi:hypothetical protein
MSLTYKHDFEAQDVIDVILNAIINGLENKLRIVQHVPCSNVSSAFKFAIVTDDCYLWIVDYEAAVYGNGDPTFIIERLRSIGCRLQFVW